MRTPVRRDAGREPFSWGTEPDKTSAVLWATLREHGVESRETAQDGRRRSGEACGHLTGVRGFTGLGAQGSKRKGLPASLSAPLLHSPPIRQALLKHLLVLSGARCGIDKWEQNQRPSVLSGADNPGREAEAS